MPAIVGTNGQVLSANGSGSLSWITIATGWGLTGNTGTIDRKNHIETNDNVALNFKVNGQKPGFERAIKFAANPDSNKDARNSENKARDGKQGKR